MGVRMSTGIRWPTAVGLAMMTVQCSGILPTPEAGTPPLRERLRVTPSRPEVPLNGSRNIQVRSRDTFYAIQLPVVWISDDPETISVHGTTAEATLRAFRYGTVTITVTDAGGASATVRARSRGND